MPASPPLLVAVTATADARDGAPRVRLNAAYVRALEGAGLVPVVIPPLADPAAAAAVLPAVHGLVLTGGEDVDPARYGAAPHPALGPLQPARDATELALVGAARARGLPTLAICRGAQLLNVAFGGTLVQDLPSERPSTVDHDPAGARARRVHPVRVIPGSRLADAVGSLALATNSFHHQAVDRPGAGLSITARATDGVVEGVEWTGDGWWALGVQWHPEELADDAEPFDRRLFAAFAAACGAPGAPGARADVSSPAAVAS